MTHEKGFSLFEVLITLSIVALLAATSISSLAGLGRQLRLEIATQELARALAMSRNEAVRRGQRITMRNDTGHWEDGWIMFVDANNNAIHDADETVLLSSQPNKQWLTIRGNSSLMSFVSYVPSGEAAQTNNAWQAGTLTICSNRQQKKGYKLTINRGGRVRQEEIAACES